MPEPTLANSMTRDFCTFRADERLFGIELASLREISTHTAVTPVPPAPPAVRGLANLRSRIHLVLDLRALLGMPSVPCTAQSRLIVLKPAVAEDAGLLVDRGGEILAVPRDQIEAVESISPDISTSGTAPVLVVGVCKLEKELMMIIDATRLASCVATLLR